MTYRGHIKNGQITLDQSAPLPEGAEVNIEVIDERWRSSQQRMQIRDRREILGMPIEQRRQLLMEQSERLAPHYGPDADRSQ
jgi:hypothetical protein